jgi:hypothetical protein
MNGTRFQHLFEAFGSFHVEFYQTEIVDSIGVVTTGTRNPRERQTSRAKPLERNRRALAVSGLDLETLNLLGLRSREKFFLDVHFYRTH